MRGRLNVLNYEDTSSYLCKVYVVIPSPMREVL